MIKWAMLFLLVCAAIIIAEARDLGEEVAEQQELEEFNRQDREVIAIVNRPKKSKVMAAECGPAAVELERVVP